MIINGYTLAIGQIPSGCGPMLWAGELRTADDKPILGRMGNLETGGQSAYPVVLALGTGAGLFQVIEKLTERAYGYPSHVLTREPRKQ